MFQIQTRTKYLSTCIVATNWFNTTMTIPKESLQYSSFQITMMVSQINVTSKGFSCLNSLPFSLVTEHHAAPKSPALVVWLLLLILWVFYFICISSRAIILHTIIFSKIISLKKLISILTSNLIWILHRNIYESRIKIYIHI